MKKIIPFFCIIMLCLSIHAQVPQAFNYQAVARNNAGAPLINSSVAIRVSIHNSTASGSVVYAERDTATTNGFGLFTCKIGTGNVISGSFSGIDWASGDKFMQVEFDATGGSSYTDLGTTQLLSVPYALNALNAQHAANTYWTGSGNDIHNTNSGNIGIGNSSPNFFVDMLYSGSGSTGVNIDYTFDGSGLGNGLNVRANKTSAGGNLVGAYVQTDAVSATNTTAVFAFNTSTGQNNVAVSAKAIGTTTGENRGVSAYATGASTNWAGYFGLSSTGDGNVYVKDMLQVGTTLYANVNGHVGIGTATPAPSAALEIKSTTGAVLLPRMSKAQRDALTAVPGMVIYNTDTGKFQGYATAEKLDQSFTNINNGGGEDRAQSFTADLTGSLTKIELPLGTMGGSYTVNVEILYGDGVGGPVLSTQQFTIASGSTTWYPISITGVNVIAGNIYTIHLTTISSCGGPICYNWGMDANGNNYAGGTFYYSGIPYNGGSTDCAFKTYVMAAEWVDLH